MFKPCTQLENLEEGARQGRTQPMLNGGGGMGGGACCAIYCSSCSLTGSGGAVWLEKRERGGGSEDDKSKLAGEGAFFVGDRRVASGEGAIHVCKHEGHYRGISRSWKLS